MKAAVFYKPGDMRIEDIVCPKPEDNEVLLKIEACGLCGSDIHLYKGSMVLPVSGNLIFGHEFTGIVVECGKSVSKYKIGDRVAVNPNIYCGRCFFCERGQENFCINRKVIGGHLFGGFSEYCKVNEKQLCFLSDNISFIEGALAEPISCCLNALNNLNIKSGDCIAIIGAGGIGLLMVQLVRNSGAGTIIVIEPNNRRKDLAVKFGATVAIDPLILQVEEMKKNLKVINIDKVIECVGKQQTIDLAISIAGRGSTVMIFGVTNSKTEVVIKPYTVFENELHITGSYINPYTFRRSIEIIKEHRIDLTEHTKMIVKLDEIMDCFTSTKYADFAKVIICP